MSKMPLELIIRSHDGFGDEALKKAFLDTINDSDFWDMSDLNNLNYAIAVESLYVDELSGCYIRKLIEALDRLNPNPVIVEYWGGIIANGNKQLVIGVIEWNLEANYEEYSSASRKLIRKALNAAFYERVKIAA